MQRERRRRGRLWGWWERDRILHAFSALFLFGSLVICLCPHTFAFPCHPVTQDRAGGMGWEACPAPSAPIAQPSFPTPTPTVPNSSSHLYSPRLLSLSLNQFGTLFCQPCNFYMPSQTLCLALSIPCLVLLLAPLPAFPCLVCPLCPSQHLCLPSLLFTPCPHTFPIFIYHILLCLINLSLLSITLLCSLSLHACFLVVYALSVLFLFLCFHCLIPTFSFCLSLHCV